MKFGTIFKIVTIAAAVAAAVTLILVFKEEIVGWMCDTKEKFGCKRVLCHDDADDFADL